MTEPRGPARRFRRHEASALVKALAGAERPLCPRCTETVECTDLPARGDVPYVRRRILLICPGCRAQVVLDQREVDRFR